VRGALGVWVRMRGPVGEKGAGGATFPRRETRFERRRNHRSLTAVKAQRVCVAFLTNVQTFAVVRVAWLLDSSSLVE